MNDLFPPTARAQASASDLDTAARVAREAGADASVLAYSDRVADRVGGAPWFSFDVGEKRYAIWRATGALYAVDEFGAVADDPLPPPVDPARELAEWLLSLDEPDGRETRRRLTLDAIFARARKVVEP